MGAKKYSPSDKAAIIVAALGEELAPEVFSQLGTEDSAKIARSLRSLGAMEQAEVEPILMEFLNILSSSKTRAIDPQGFISSLQKKGDTRSTAFLENLGRGEYHMRVFDRTRPEVLYRIIRNEAPQTLALIFSHAPSEFAANLLKEFPEAQRLDILLRMATIQEVDPELVQELDEQLIHEIDKLGSSRSQTIGGIKKVAEILNAMNQEATPLLERISERNSQLAGDIQQEMFTFDDLLKIDERGMQEMVKGFRRETLILALRGASVTLVQRFAAGMSERSAKMFREDLEALGAQKKSDVMKARNELVNHARSLIESGKISFGQQGAYI